MWFRWRLVALVLLLTVNQVLGDLEQDCGETEDRITCKAAKRREIKILSPVQGQHFRSGSRIGTVVRAEEPVPGELVTRHETKLSVLIDDKEIGGSCTSAEHRGLLPPLADGWHEIRACWASDDTSCNIVQFEIGPPRPSVRITQPLNGSFIIDNPLTIFYIVEDFVQGEDGQMSLIFDGKEQGLEAQQSFVELQGLLAGPHHACIVLTPPAQSRAPKISQCIHFTFRTPEVQFVYPAPNSRGIRSIGGTVSLSVVLMVLHVTYPVAIRLRVSSSTAGRAPPTGSVQVSHVLTRADYYMFDVVLTGVDPDAGLLELAAELFEAHDETDSELAAGTLSSYTHRLVAQTAGACSLSHGLLTETTKGEGASDAHGPARCRHYFVDAVRPQHPPPHRRRPPPASPTLRAARAFPSRPPPAHYPPSPTLDHPRILTVNRVSA